MLQTLPTAVNAWSNLVKLFSLFNQGVNKQPVEAVAINLALMCHAMFNKKFANIQLERIGNTSDPSPRV